MSSLFGSNGLGRRALGGPLLWPAVGSVLAVRPVSWSLMPSSRKPDPSSSSSR
jgi:hypothetical protein